MINFFKSLPYHFKSAFKSISRNVAMSISSATAVSVTLVLIMLFLIVAGNINQISRNVEQSIQIFVRIDPIVEVSNYENMQKQIEAIDHVVKVEYSDKDDQFKRFVESDQGGKQYSIFKDDNPLYAAFYVDADEGQNVETIAKKIESIEGIFDVSFGGESASIMLDAFNTIRLAGGIFVIGLCFLAIFLISNTIKITIHARSEEIAIMRNVGADNVFIKTPFMIEGMLIGFAGAIIPIIITIFGYGYTYDLLDGVLFSSMFTLLAPFPFVYIVSLILVLLGMIVGILGSFLSVNKYLKWKR